jgi:hypothetical protein
VRVLLDESVPTRLASLLRPHDVVTVTQRRWRGLSNGELLSRAAAEFDVLVTADRRMEHQQNIPRSDLGLIVLRAHRNRFKDYEPLLPALLKAIEDVRSGQVIHVAA